MDAEVLKKGLEGENIELTDEQLSVIATVATINEEAAIQNIQRNSIGLVEKLTGVKMGENMRQEDYFKSAIDTHVTKIVGEKDGVISKLNEQIGANKDELSIKYNDLLKEKQSFTETLAQTEARLKLEAEEARKELANYKDDFTLKSFMPTNFKVEDKAYNDYLSKQALDKVKGEYEIVKKDGSVVLKKDFKEYSPQDVFKNILKDSLKQANQGGGAGGGEGGNGGTLNLSSITGATKVEFTTNLEKALIANGFKKGSKEYGVEYLKAKDTDFYKQLKLN